MSHHTNDINAMNEFIAIMKGRTPLCATITHEDVVIALKVGYSDEYFHEFLQQLNFKYYAGYGEQHLFGTIWTDSGWYSRGEYDGQEWWKYNCRPMIPLECCS